MDKPNGYFEKLNNLRVSHLGVVLFYGYLVAILVASTLAFKSYFDLRKIADSNHTAICTLRGDYQKRLKDTQRFIREHPKGIPGLASREDLMRSADGLRRNVKALEGAKC